MICPRAFRCGPEVSFGLSIKKINLAGLPSKDSKSTPSLQMPKAITNVDVEIFCSAEKTDKNTNDVSSGGYKIKKINLGMKVGETQSFPTDISLDLNVFRYHIGCKVIHDFSDPDSSNNELTKVIE